MECFYVVLDIKRDASPSEIKKAYRKLAMRWHPDKNLDNKEVATERFKEISQAYEVLSIPEKRRLYDQYGHEAVMGDTSGGSQHSSGGMYGGGGGFHDFGFEHANDIFRQFFGGRDPFASFHDEGVFGGGRGGGRPQRTRGGRNEQYQQQQQQPMMMDPFAGFGFGGGGFSMMDNMMNMGMGMDMMGGGGMGGFSSFSSSSSSSFGGGGGTSRSVSTTTSIGPDGRRVTRTETRTVHPDGRVESNVTENVEGAGVGDRLEYDRGYDRRGQLEGGWR